MSLILESAIVWMHRGHIGKLELQSGQLEKGSTVTMPQASRYTSK